VEADGCGDVEVEIRVMNSVQAPQGGRVVEEDMLDIDEEVEEDDPGEDGNSVRHLEIVQKAPTFLSAKQGKAHGKDGEEESDNERIYCHDPEVGKPARRLGRTQYAPRRPSFQKGEDEQRAQEESQSD